MATRGRVSGAPPYDPDREANVQRAREEALKVKAESMRGAKAMGPTPEGGSLSSALEELAMSLGNVEDHFSDLVEKLSPITRPSDDMAAEFGRTREDSCSQVRYMVDGFTDRLNTLYARIRDLKYGIDL